LGWTVSSFERKLETKRRGEKMQDKTILIVEDELMIAEDILESLTEMGYHVPCTAASGSEALDKIQLHRPDLVLMDIMLKGEWDGIQTAEAIHKMHDCAIIYLTAYTDQKMLQRAKITSPFGYILKPFREKELHAMVEISLYRHEIERQNRLRQQLFLDTLTQTPEAIIVTDDQGLLQFMNPAAEQLTGLKAATTQKQSVKSLLSFYDEQGQGLESWLKPGLNQRLKMVLPEARQTLVRLGVSAIQNGENQTSGYILNLIAEAPRPGVSERSESGELLSVCASCKNIRNPEGQYVAMEQFFREHFGCRFSHGICTGCFETLYPDYLLDSP